MCACAVCELSLSRTQKQYTKWTCKNEQKQLLNWKINMRNELKIVGKSWKSIQIFACLSDISVSMRRGLRERERAKKRSETKHAEEKRFICDLWLLHIFFWFNKTKEKQRNLVFFSCSVLYSPFCFLFFFFTLIFPLCLSHSRPNEEANFSRLTANPKLNNISDCVVVFFFYSFLLGFLAQC